MQGKIAQQDLTAYALNELEPHSRLYVESLLAVSEPAREDVYAMIDLAMLLEDSFESQEDNVPALLLTSEQRQRLLQVEVPNGVRQTALALLAAAACVALAFGSQQMWVPKGSAGRVAKVSSNVGNYVADAVASTADGEDLFARLTHFRELAGDPLVANWLNAESSEEGMPAANLSGPVWDATASRFDFMP